MKLKLNNGVKMKLFSYAKDGGVESTVWGIFFIEIKKLFSVVLLRFENGSREAYHSHAFNCFSWVIRGRLEEHHLNGKVDIHTASILPFMTKRDTFHQVFSVGRTWVISFRGPWVDVWNEFLPATGEMVALTHGRREV